MKDSSKLTYKDLGDRIETYISKKDNTIEDAENMLSFLRKIREEDPYAVVSITNGECDSPGVYAPIIKGEPDFDQRKYFDRGMDFPEDWGHVIQVGLQNSHTVTIGRMK